MAVARLLDRSDNGLGAKRLFNDAERHVLAQSITETNATANLLGRARVRERWAQALRKHDPERFAELPPHVEMFDEPEPRNLKPMPPAKAVSYFRRLVPTIGVKEPERFGQLLQRNAFTLAVDVDAIVLDKIKGVIQTALETGRGVRAAPAEIENLLTSAGVSPRNPQYAEMVQRTNMMDAYAQGTQEEMRDPDVADVFPAWRYLAVKDARTRPHHAQHNERYFSNDTLFTEVRDAEAGKFDGYNCRCVQQPVDKWTWTDLQKRGARISTFAETFAAGTCKPGQRSDLTGCTPATKDGPGEAVTPAAQPPATEEPPGSHTTMAAATAWGEKHGVKVVTGESGIPVSRDQLNHVNAQVAKIPAAALAAAQQTGSRLDVVGGRGITDHPSNAHFKGVTPRGWEGSGKTWDDVPGGSATKAGDATIISARAMLNPTAHGSANLVLHEHAHTIDLSLAKTSGLNTRLASHQDDWKAIHAREKWGSEYETKFPEEAWAESFARMYHSPKTRQEVPESARAYFLKKFGDGSQPRGSDTKHAEAPVRLVLAPVFDAAGNIVGDIPVEQGQGPSAESLAAARPQVEE